MNAPYIKSVIPEAYADLEGWPTPDELLMSEDRRPAYVLRRRAVQLYACGTPFSEIHKQTGKVKSEVFRLVKRCLKVAPDGQIFGYRALVQSVRVASYERVVEVKHSPGSGSAGCAGALGQLFAAYPEVEDLVVDMYLKQTRAGMREARAGINVIHARFKTALRDLCFTNEQWPFNTGNCGYKSLARYCSELRNRQPEWAIGARSGREAQRKNAIGTGITAILPCVRPYSAVQLDFHKVDAASVFILTNDHGKQFEVPLTRWHFGLMVDEKSGAAVGFCVALEKTPSGDSTLDVVSSALGSAPEESQDVVVHTAEDVLVYQLMPELTHQCFSILKVDNGWSNAAHVVVNNIITTVGCAVNFGPTRAWWRRNLIERIFGELTRRGLQRLPSTFGKGTGDTRRDNPNNQAATFRITLDDLVRLFKRCLREHNLADSEGKQWTSPIQFLRASFSNPRSGFFRQPLPASSQNQLRLMMHMQEVTVVGNAEKGERPYFNLDRHRHTNEQLAHSYWLIGKVLIAYVDRKLARIVYATVKDTGEHLGRMYPAGPWADSDCSWRDRKLMGRAGMAARMAGESEDPLEVIKKEKIEQLKKRKKSERNKSSNVGLDVMRIEAQQDGAASREALFHADPTSESKADGADQGPKEDIGGRDPFGLYDIPRLSNQ